MTIFDYIEDKKYFDYCFYLCKCKDLAHDLKMDAALKIHENGCKLEYPYALFRKVAYNLFCDQKKLPQLTELPEHLTEIENINEYDPQIIIDLLKQPPKTKRQFVTNEIFKLYLQLGTEQAVSDYTGINRNTIHSQIKKFKKYARENLDID
jgi:DNA-directed RNA polymerase specialized sigma24 family protein